MLKTECKEFLFLRYGDRNKNNHIGREISRSRELRGMKEEALAEALGVNQQSVRNIEKSEEVEDQKLGKLLKSLKLIPKLLEISMKMLPSRTSRIITTVPSSTPAQH